MNEQPPFEPHPERPVPPTPYGGSTEDTAAVPASPAAPAPDGPAPDVPGPGVEDTAVRPPHAADQGPEHTAVLGVPWTPLGQAPTHPALGAPAQPEPRKSRRGAGVGLVVASLLLGGAAGFGGAAAFHALDDDGTTGSSNGAVATVIDQGSSPARAGSVEAVAAKVLPSVVRIDVSSANGSGSGSGIVLSADGRILTNDHVVDGAGDGATLRVSFSDGTRATAQVLGKDPLTDTAVIQAEGVSDLTPATIGKSSNLKVGQQVVAIGAPFGLDATVTSGIVSALERPVNVGTAGTQGNSTTYPAIQTDAAINPGNSGGPLVDMTGSVIGINSSIRTAGNATGEAGSIGLGFAIPMDPMMPIVEQMTAGETPTHARLGITVTSSQDPVAVGAQVREVSDGSTAERAGLESGDLVTKVDDRLIDGSDDLVATVRSFRPGDEVTLTYVRKGEEKTVTLVLDSDAEQASS